MTTVVDIQGENRRRIGAISFDQSADRLTAQRTAAGFELAFPITVSLELRATSDARPQHSRGTLLKWRDVRFRGLPSHPRRPSRDRKAGNLAGGGKFVAQIRRPRNRRYFLTNSMA
jgi:hypothetical protein